MTRFAMEVDRSARRSSVRDSETGVVEEAEFYDAAGGFLAGVTTRGVDAPTAAVLICNSLHAEGLKNYRRETLLSRRLVGEGIISHRFDYRGAGDSSGSVEAISVPTMAEDILAAAAHLGGRAAGLPLGIVATRMAAIPVARALADLDARAVVLWQPVVDYAKFFRDVDRTKGLQDRAEALRAENEGRQIEPRPPILEQLEAGGVADVMGFSYGIDLHETMGAADPIADLTAAAAPVQIIQMSQREKVQKPLADLADALQGAGGAAELHVVAGEEENWWFRTGVQGFHTEEDRTLTASVLDLTVPFLTEYLQGGR